MANSPKVHATAASADFDEGFNGIEAGAGAVTPAAAEEPSVAPIKAAKEPDVAPAQTADDDGGTKAAKDVAPAQTDDGDGGTTLSGTIEISDAQLMTHLDGRVKNAETKIDAGRKMEADGMRMQNDGADELRAARRDKNKYFPPATQAQNVKSFIEASNAERAARVRQQGTASHLDAIRRPGGGSINRGYGRGASRGAYSRQEAARLGFKVPGSGMGGVRA